MGDSSRKSFWPSLPGILTGVAAVVAAIGGILAAQNYGSAPTPSPTPAPTTSENKIVCGKDLPGVTLFG